MTQSTDPLTAPANTTLGHPSPRLPSFPGRASPSHGQETPPSPACRHSHPMGGHSHPTGGHSGHSHPMGGHSGHPIGGHSHLMGAPWVPLLRRVGNRHPRRRRPASPPQSTSWQSSLLSSHRPARLRSMPSSRSRPATPAATVAAPSSLGPNYSNTSIHRRALQPRRQSLGASRILAWTVVHGYRRNMVIWRPCPVRWRLVQ